MYSLVKTLTVLAASLAAVTAGSAILPELFGAEAICGKDDSRPSICVKDQEPKKYQLGQAIARIRVRGSYCSGFLWGSEGHLITANPCILNADDANKTVVELASECSTCADPDNDKPEACVGTIAANSTTFVYGDSKLWFSLVKLNLNPGVDLKKHGYLQARATKADLDEPVYIIGHPKLKPTRISWLFDNNTHARITNTSAISLCAQNDTLAYNVDTETGSAGAPIVSANDNKVLAVHYCGGCTATGGANTGAKMENIVKLLQSKNLLPKDAVADDHC